MNAMGAIREPGDNYNMTGNEQADHKAQMVHGPAEGFSWPPGSPATTSSEETESKG